VSGLVELVPSVDARVDGYVVGCAASAEHAYVLTGEGELSALSLRTGEPLFRVKAHEAGAQRLALHPRKPLVATAGQDGVARLFDGHDGRVVAELPGTNAWIEHVAFSPTGELLATASGKRVRIWSDAGEPLFESEEHESTVSGLQFGRDGKRLATAAYGCARVLSLKDKRTTHRFRWKGSLVSLAWSPDDKVLVCGSQDCSVHFWRLATGQDSAMTGYRFKPTELAWDQRASLLATGGDATITVWDFSGKGPEGSRPIQLGAHKALVSALAFAPKRGWLASGAEETAVMLWEPRKQNVPLAFSLLDDMVTQVAWTTSGDTLVACSAAGKIAAYPVRHLAAA